MADEEENKLREDEVSSSTAEDENSEKKNSEQAQVLGVHCEG